MILRERNLSQKKNIYLIEGYKNEIVQKSPESGKLEKFAKTNNVKTNDFDLIIRSNNSYQPYTPFIKEKKYIFCFCFFFIF